MIQVASKEKKQSITDIEKEVAEIEEKSYSDRTDGKIISDGIIHGTMNRPTDMCCVEYKDKGIFYSTERCEEIYVYNARSSKLISNLKDKKDIVQWNIWSGGVTTDAWTWSCVYL